jgi:hypothetical protein
MLMHKWANGQTYKGWSEVVHLNVAYFANIRGARKNAAMDKHSSLLKVLKHRHWL